MKKMIMIAAAFMMTGCASLPQLYTAAEEVLDDNAIKIEIQKEAMKADTDVQVDVYIINKEPSVIKPLPQSFPSQLPVPASKPIL